MINQVNPIPNLIKQTTKNWVSNNIETLSLAKITKISNFEVDRVVSVQPLAHTLDSDGVEVVPAVIDNCNMLLQGNSEGFLKFPPRVGDDVIIGFPKESLEEYLYSSTTDTYSPIDTELFGGAQAVVLGYVSKTQGIDLPTPTTDMELRFKDCLLTFKESNEVVVNNANTNITVSPNGTVTITTPSNTMTLTDNGGWDINGGEGKLNGATITTGGNVITANGTDLDLLQANFDKLWPMYNSHSPAPTTPFTPIT